MDREGEKRKEADQNFIACNKHQETFGILFNFAWQKR